MAASGTGALLAAFYLGTRKSVRGLGYVITLGGACMGLAMISFAMSRWLPLSFVCLMLAGCGGVLLMASSNTLVQTMVEDDKRGRVMSIFTMAFTGTAPLGNLVAGALASRIGAFETLVINGALCIVVMMAFFWRLPKLRAAAAPVLMALDPVMLDPLVSPANRKP